jgi:hypothetical protein|eukprot:COSAG01_NODE_5881_length_3971_cov_6.184353_6_plen_350_part_00
MATELAKRGAGAAVSQLRETEIGTLAKVLRWANILVGVGLIVGSGLLTLSNAVGMLWCDDDVAVVESGHRCYSVYVDEVGEGVTACTTDACLDCLLECRLGVSELFSTIVISLYMPLLGTVIIMFEMQRNLNGGFIRRMLEKYFGFLFLYKQRSYFLLFCGLLSLGNTTVELGDEAKFKYVWGGLAGAVTLASALLHFAVRCLHPGFDKDMIGQLENSTRLRALDGALDAAATSTQATDAAGNGGGGDHVAARTAAGYGASGGGRGGGDPDAGWAGRAPRGAAAGAEAASPPRGLLVRSPARAGGGGAASVPPPAAVGGRARTPDRGDDEHHAGLRTVARPGSAAPVTN